MAPREIRELVRYRRKLSQLQSGLKAQVHQTLDNSSNNIPARLLTAFATGVGSSIVTAV